MQQETQIQVIQNIGEVTYPPWVDRNSYPFHTKLMPLGQHTIHLVDEGAGSPIVFSHGTPTWSFEYRHLIKHFSRMHRCIALDHLGFGFSSRPKNEDYSPEAHAKRFSQFMNQLNLPKITLVIHDFGGPIALDWALNNPEQVERLVVLNTFMWPFDDDKRVQQGGKLMSTGFGRFMYRHLNASLRLITPSAYGDKKKLTKEIHRQYLNVFPDADSRELVLYALAKALLNSRNYYQSLYERREALRKIPTTIIWGMKDSAFPVHNLRKWESICPHAQVVQIEGAGHWPHEEEPQKVIAAMESFR